MSTTATRATSKTGNDGQREQGQASLAHKPESRRKPYLGGTKNDEDVGAACDRNKKHDRQQPRGKYYGRMEGFTAHFCKVMEGTERSFTYHGNTICMVDDTRRRVHLTNAGWNTPSTSRAINDYRRYFVEECGYTEVKDI